MIIFAAKHIYYMRKALYFVIIATFSLFFLQAMWIHSMYQKYKEEYQVLTNNVFLEAINKEVGLRGKFEDPKNPRLFYKRAEDITPKERASYKSDTIYSFSAMQKKGIAESMAELFAQITQDNHLKNNNLPCLATVDSLISDTLDYYNARRCIYLYNKEGKVIAQFGYAQLDTTNCLSSIKKPIGTKGLLFMQLKTETPKNAFVSQMSYLLLSSIAIVGIVLGCLVYQLTVIRRKERLLKKREASVNGTVHDLKSPLNGVLTLLNWLTKGEPNEQKQKMIQEAALQVRHLATNIDSILISAREERQKIVLHKTEVSLPQLIETVKNNLPAQFAQKPHRLKLINNLTNPIINIDAPYMENVFKNLIENSLKYSDDGVEIEIELTENSNNIQVTVKDNGWGIPRKYQRKLFTQYYQVPREEARMKKGYGVGLCYAWYIVRAHGGRLKLNSRENEGCTFTFFLPRSN